MSAHAAHREQRAHARHKLGMKSRYLAPSRSALLLASRSGADARTCERALREGAHVIRTRNVREAIELAARELAIALPAPEGS